MATVTFTCETAGDSFKGFLQRGDDGPIRELEFTGTSKKGKCIRDLTPAKYRYIVVTIGPPKAKFKGEIDGATPAAKPIQGEITAKFIGGGARIFQVAVLAMMMILGFMPRAAQAQDPSEFEASYRAALTQERLADPTLDSPFVAPAEAVKFEVSRENKTAAAMISKSELWHIKVSGPIAEGADEVKLANLRGLTGSAKLDLGMKIRLSDWNVKINENELTTCFAKETAENRDGTLCLFDDENVDKIVTIKGMKSLIATQFEFSRPRFEYANTTTLEAATETHSAYGGTVAFGILPLKRGVYFASLGYRYENSYEPKKKKQICRPISGTDGLECTTSSFGGPERSVKRIAELESRVFLGRKRDVAIAPVIAYEMKTSTLGFDVPFYFFMGKNGLDGGVRIGWRSDTEEFTASLFVGMMDDLFK